MKFALVNGQREEAQPHLSGRCPACESSLVARCGEVRVRHWAHKGRFLCERWWEPETEWHRAWKDHFPVDWQEIVHRAANDQRHIADVKTDDGWVIEFQHSYLKPDERRSREAFYPKLVWVVDGTRRKRDRTQLGNAWRDGVAVRGNPLVRKVYLDDCRLLQEWAGGMAPSFFDLGEPESLWWLVAKTTTGWAYLLRYPRAKFIEFHRNTGTEVTRKFDAVVVAALKMIAGYESPLRAPLSGQIPAQPRRIRRHFRF